MKPQSLRNSNTSVFFLAFFLGWASFSLKLVSIVKLLGELNFELYPLLMLAQGVSLFASLKLMTKVSENNERLFYLISLIAGFIIVVFTNTFEINDWVLSEYGWKYSCIVFILSTLIILAIDVTTRLLVTNKISMLQNPKAASYVTFSGEFGVMVGATLSYFINLQQSIYPSFVMPFLMSLPFTISLILLFSISGSSLPESGRKLNPKIEKALSEHSISLKAQLKRYLPVLIALVTAVMLCKYFQGFAVILGLKQWQENSNQTITAIFSILAVAQNGLVLLMILPSFFEKGRSTVWSKGFNILFYIQSISMFIITIVPTPATLIGTGVIRKIAQRSFLGQSLNMLFSSIPKSVRFEAKSKSQKYAHTIAFVTLSIVSYLAINELIIYAVVWMLALVSALVGIILVRLLIQRLNRFHVENILEFSRCPFNVYEAISSCYSLANKDAHNYYPKISNIISKKYSRSIFAKALIHTMGEMKNKGAIDYLFNLFAVAKREDVQLEILKALNRFDSLEVDDFMLNVLKKTMYEDTQRGELRTSFCEVISKRLPEASISAATHAIEKNENDSRVVGNAIDILGEIGHSVQTKKVQQYLVKFLSNDYPRRVKLNTIRHLYHLPKHRQKIEQLISELKRSSTLDDQAGAAYLYGALRETGEIEFISELNVQTKRRNATVLLSLIRLGDEGAEIDFIHLLREAESAQALVYVKQLYRVREHAVRYSIYSAILERYPEDISYVLHAMRDSYKNFDRDRQVIIEEAERRGITISDDLLYLIQ